MKKKIIVLLSFLILLTGCTNVRDLSYEEIINRIAIRPADNNIFRTGYSYYLPRNMKVSNSKLYNEVIEDANYKYYLYVDIVSYYKKVSKDYSVNIDALVSKSINYNGKFGYVEVKKLENLQYLVEIMYNYAKIEVIVDEYNLKASMSSIINILKSVEYNDSIIANLMGDDILNFSESEFNIFDTSDGESNYLTAGDSFTKEEEKKLDPDLIN